MIQDFSEVKEQHPTDKYWCECCQNNHYEVQLTVKGEDSYMVCHECSKLMINGLLTTEMKSKLLSKQHRYDDHYLK